MDRATVKSMVEAELASAEEFANWHGITSENIHEFLIEPVPVTVVIWGEEPGLREMWLALQEDEAQDGYCVAFDAAWNAWGLVTRNDDGKFTLVSGTTDTFLDQVCGM
jgi:hypothetical protein